MKKTYVIDIETVARPGIEDTFYINWAYKKGAKDEQSAIERASLHPEFGMICSIGIGEYGGDDSTPMTKVSTNLAEEKDSLVALATYINEDCIIVGHNIKRFDIPYLVKGYLRHGLPIPKSLRYSNESNWKDTMEILAMGGSQMSLRAACLNMGIRDPKAKVCGENIHDLFMDGDMGAISDYNASDVAITMEVWDRIIKSGLID